MVDADDVRARLVAAGAQLAEADEARQVALGAIAAAMKEGHGKIDVKQMAELAGVSRVTAYRLLEK